MILIKCDLFVFFFRWINFWCGSSMRKWELVMCLYDIFLGVGCMLNLKIDSWLKYYFFFLNKIVLLYIYYICYMKFENELINIIF